MHPIENINSLRLLSNMRDVIIKAGTMKSQVILNY